MTMAEANRAMKVLADAIPPWLDEAIDRELERRKWWKHPRYAFWRWRNGLPL
jgi:hypothetical protein